MQNNEKKLRVVHLFSGIGAPERALTRLKIPFEIVGYSEIDKYAIQAYRALNGDVPSLGSIKDIERLPKADLVVYGSPCTDFSCAGKQQGLIDSEGNQTRSGLLFEVERLLETAKANDELPEYLCMENVKNLVSKKFKPDFDRWLNKLEELGYNNYWKVINAKDYLVAQNRERVFVISIRKDLAQTYKFPEPKPLTKRLKDILEPKVDEKYYLSEKAIQGFIRHNKNHEAKGTGFLWKPKTGEDTANCLRANGALAPTDNTIIEEGNIYPNSGNPQAGRIYNSDGISPCLDTCSGGNRMPKIIEEPVIAASRGRNPENPSDRTAGAPTEQRLEINSQGIANTLTTVQKDNLVIEPTVEQVGQTDSHQKGGVYNPNGIIPTLLASDYKQPKQIIERADGIYTNASDEFQRPPLEGLSRTLKSGNHDAGVLTNPPFRVRRLTPRECWRLMAFTDEEFDKVQARGISNTQLYKMAGNSIVVNCLVALFFNLLKKPTKRENE